MGLFMRDSSRLTTTVGFYCCCRRLQEILINKLFSSGVFFHYMRCILKGEPEDILTSSLLLPLHPKYRSYKNTTSGQALLGLVESLTLLCNRGTLQLLMLKVSTAIIRFPRLSQVLSCGWQMHNRTWSNATPV